MNEVELVATARAMFADGKGLLAMDESEGTCNRRFAALGIPQTAERRRAWRRLIVGTPQLASCIGGAILCDETFRQTSAADVDFAQALFDRGIVPGIKVDAGVTDLAGHPGESVTEGLDGLRARLREYVAGGARFAKWRAVIRIGPARPTDACIEANAHALARYAAACQEAGLVPIVEPDVLMAGDHGLARCRDVTERALRTVFRQLVRQGVLLEGTVLKPNMVLPGTASAERPGLDEVADTTLGCLLRTVPAAVPAIAFLSGGQAPELASARLNAMHVRFRGRLPWRLAFSYSRAIQQPALERWGGDDAHAEAARRALLHRATCNRAALAGEYLPSMEDRVGAAPR